MSPEKAQALEGSDGESSSAKVHPVLKAVLGGVAAVWFLADFVYVWFGYFVTSRGPDGLHDGLGRHLSQAPMLMRIFFNQDRMWAGWSWFFADMVIVWGSLAIIMLIVRRLVEDE